MPTPTIPDGRLFMNATLYTGTGASLAVKNGATGQSFQPDFVWVKGRSGATDHALYDSVRGVQNQLESNNTDAETAEATGLTAFGSNGFTVGALAQMNTSAATYVGWQWKAGGAAVTNTAGSISSQVSANTTSGFSVVTYPGNGTGGATVGHGLGVAPAMIIVKRRDDVVGWFVWHTAFNSATAKMDLNSTDAIFSSNVYLNSTFPSSSVVTLGTSGYTNASGGTYVMYAWSQIAGYSAFGSYTGNGSTDGPFVYTGFRPRYVLIKNTSDAGQLWCLHDTSVNPYNLAATYLAPNNSNGDAGSATDNPIDILSNGFKIRYSNTVTNNSGVTMIYAAFAENPFKYANAR